MDQEKMSLLPSLDPKRSDTVAFNSSGSVATNLEAEDQRRLLFQRRKRIIGHIFVICALLGLLFYKFMKSPRHFEFGHKPGNHQHRFHPHDAHLRWSDEDPLWVGRHTIAELPFPSEMADYQCAEWPEVERNSPARSSTVQTVEHTFELPLTSEVLFLLAQGPFMNGNVNITQSDEDRDSVVISVDTSYDDAEFLQSIQLCKVAGREGENGVGIFSSRRRPHPPRHDLHVYFDIRVEFPKGPEKSRLLVSDFKTDMRGAFGYQVANLSNTIFNSVSLSGASKPIQVELLQAQSIQVKAVNSPIEGNFTVDKSLRLSTANAHINVAATLLNNKADESMTETILNTVNSPIEASLSLFSFDSGEAATSDGAFCVRAHNAHSPIKLTFPTAPINSTVHVNAKTAMAPVDVQMHSTFEGAFTAQNSPFDKRVINAEEGPDPEGRDRKRNLIFDEMHRGTAKGHVYWGTGERGKDRGSVRLNTVAGQISLQL
ncbi:hypothetical protein FB446DRAFT_372022 [Lentinula raphanica]|nr:hypothetical protein FB446DRAFT_372022 [Lentinula raphanica]